MRYKVVLVPFPFDDLSAVKVRPAVCLTEPIGLHNHIVIAFITSQTPAKPLETDLMIDSSMPGFTGTGLKANSTVQIHRLMTVSKSFLLRELGVLPVSMQRDIRTRLQKLFRI